MKRVIGTIILIIAIICFGWSAFSLGKYAWQAHTTQKNIDQLADRINTDVTEASDDSDDSDEEDPVAESEAMMEKYGDLYNENKDFIGWLSIEGTNINNPVMYTPDDPEHYLRKNFNGDYDIGGMLFVDSRCTFNPSSTDTIIYGHHMKNGTMFGSLHQYLDAAYMKEHQYVYVVTPEEELIYQVFAAVEYDDRHILQSFSFTEAYGREAYLDSLRKNDGDNDYFREDVEATENDRLLTLSTCIKNESEKRLLVEAVLVNESER